MKISSLIMYLLMVGVVFFSFALISTDINNYYPETAINSSEWDGEYDYVQRLNDSVNPLKEKYEVIEDEEQGWYTKLWAGISAIPYAVILFPRVLFSGLAIGSEAFSNFLYALAIPSYIILALLIGMMIWAMFKLLEFFQRSKV